MAAPRRSRSSIPRRTAATSLQSFLQWPPVTPADYIRFSLSGPPLTDFEWRAARDDRDRGGSLQRLRVLSPGRKLRQASMGQLHRGVRHVSSAFHPRGTDRLAGRNGANPPSGLAFRPSWARTTAANTPWPASAGTEWPLEAMGN
jgi:hypothetical protein